MNVALRPRLISWLDVLRGPSGVEAPDLSRLQLPVPRVQRLQPQYARFLDGFEAAGGNTISRRPLAARPLGSELGRLNRDAFEQAVRKPVELAPALASEARASVGGSHGGPADFVASLDDF